MAHEDLTDGTYRGCVKKQLLVLVLVLVGVLLAAGQLARAQAGPGHGTDIAFVRSAFGGNDAIYGEGGNDTILGGPAIDEVAAVAGDGRVVAGPTVDAVVTRTPRSTASRRTASISGTDAGMLRQRLSPLLQP